MRGFEDVALLFEERKSLRCPPRGARGPSPAGRHLPPCGIPKGHPRLSRCHWLPHALIYLLTSLPGEDGS